MPIVGGLLSIFIWVFIRLPNSFQPTKNNQNITQKFIHNNDKQNLQQPDAYDSKKCL